MFKFIPYLILVGLAIATLQVYGPACAKDGFQTSLQYTLSNFGQIPYAQTIIGKIILPKSEELCDTENQSQINNNDPTTKTFLLVKRGGCKFTKKVINAQNLGADLIIIYDNVPGSTPSVIMKNDGHGHLAQIPSIFLSNSDGERLVAKSKTCSSMPVLRVHFDMDQRQTSTVTLWLDAGNRETYILARDFHKNDYFNILKDRIDFEIRFRIENTCEDWICSKDDCVGVLTEKYCRNVPQPEKFEISYTKGSDLIREQLREYYLWEEIQKQGADKQQWWRYMSKFDHNICLEKADVEDCSISTMQELPLSQLLISNVKAKSDEAISKVSVGDPNILRQSYQESRQMGIYFYPEVTINDRNFYGLFKAPEVFEAICDSLIDPPRECISFVKENHNEQYNDETGGLWFTVFIILLVMTLGFLVALVIYTKVIKREVNQQLSLEVNKMVEKYVNLGSKKSGNSSANSYSKFDS